MLDKAGGVSDTNWLGESVGPIAGPTIVGRVIDHGGAHGVEFDVALASK